MPTVNILEDPIFRSSKSPYMIQCADFTAYALFQKEKPTPARRKYGLNESFGQILFRACNTKASKDEYGIIR